MLASAMVVSTRQLVTMRQNVPGRREHLHLGASASVGESTTLPRSSGGG
jgi:hypothetical protein